METKILTCECHSTEHQIVVNYDDEDNIVFCHIYLSGNDRGFFKRLKYGIKYIFGYKCRFGHWDEFIFNHKEVNKLEEIVKLLKNGNNKPASVDKN